MKPKVWNFMENSEEMDLVRVSVEKNTYTRQSVCVQPSSCLHEGFKDINLCISGTEVELCV